MRSSCGETLGWMSPGVRRCGWGTRGSAFLPLSSLRSLVKKYLPKRPAKDDPESK